MDSARSLVGRGSADLRNHRRPVSGRGVRSDSPSQHHDRHRAWPHRHRAPHGRGHQRRVPGPCREAIVAQLAANRSARSVLGDEVECRQPQCELVSWGEHPGPRAQRLPERAPRRDPGRGRQPGHDRRGPVVLGHHRHPARRGARRGSRRPRQRPPPRGDRPHPGPFGDLERVPGGCVQRRRRAEPPGRVRERPRQLWQPGRLRPRAGIRLPRRRRHPGRRLSLHRRLHRRSRVHVHRGPRGVQRRTR